jgi:hypothetical protein
MTILPFTPPGNLFRAHDPTEYTISLRPNEILAIIPNTTSHFSFFGGSLEEFTYSRPLTLSGPGVYVVQSLGAIDD